MSRSFRQLGCLLFVCQCGRLLRRDRIGMISSRYRRTAVDFLVQRSTLALANDEGSCECNVEHAPSLFSAGRVEATMTAPLAQLLLASQRGYLLFHPRLVNTIVVQQNFKKKKRWE